MAPEKFLDKCLICKERVLFGNRRVLGLRAMENLRILSIERNSCIHKSRSFQRRLTNIVHKSCYDKYNNNINWQPTALKLPESKRHAKRLKLSHSSEVCSSIQEVRYSNYFSFQNLMY